MYEFLTGKSPNLNKWIIHLPAGAWCSSVEDCYSRPVVLYTIVLCPCLVHNSIHKKTCLLNLWNDHKTLHFLEPIHTCRQKTLLVLMIMNKYIFMTDIKPISQ